MNYNNYYDPRYSQGYYQSPNYNYGQNYNNLGQQNPNNNYYQNQNNSLVNNNQMNNGNSFLKLIYVNGVEDAKNYIVNPNQVAYLKDQNSNRIFEKRADQNGKYFMKVYELREINQEQGGGFVTKEDFTNLQSQVQEILNSLKGGNTNEPKQQ